ncbi:hypothetical protein BT69DRAFT_468160 [Atractiella rhizophila]|nr:hypothetical protein BT69DRAFT_468160 [Atractiella rhizophila]
MLTSLTKFDPKVAKKRPSGDRNSIAFVRTVAVLPRWHHDHDPASSKWGKRRLRLTSLALPLTFLLFGAWLLSPSDPLISTSSPPTASSLEISKTVPQQTAWTSTHPPPRPLFKENNGDGEEEKFLTFLPHSGFHNQRIALQNALSLAAFTGRTLLLPPIWTGRPIHLDTYKWLKGRWEKAVGDGHGGMEFVAWDFMFDLSFVEEAGVRLANRWGREMEESRLLESLDFTEKDVLRIEEEIALPKIRYDLQYVSTPSPTNSLIDAIPSSELVKFHRNISLPILRTRPEKLLLFGSLFGTDRFVLDSSIEYTPEWFRARLVPRQERLKTVARRMAVMLGGEQRYIGALGRVGDGVFKKEEVERMQRLHDELIVQLNNQEKPKSGKGGTLDSRLACKKKLHTEPSKQVFNAPLYLATDSHSPSTLPSLAPLYETFPCLFTLSDFMPLLEEEIDDIMHWKSDDGISIGSLMLPMLDGMVAAGGYVVQGTWGSTFGDFAMGPLHNYYSANGI